MKKLTQTTCTDCSFYAQNHWTATLECGGLLLQPGCRACLGGKRPRRFRSGDPKVALPAWCPRRKNPCDVRIYELKSSHDWLLHHALSTQLGHAITPTARRYGLAATLQTELTAQAFWKRAMPPSVASPLPVPIALYGATTASVPSFSIRRQRVWSCCPTLMQRPQNTTPYPRRKEPPYESERETAGPHGRSQPGGRRTGRTH